MAELACAACQNPAPPAAKGVYGSFPNTLAAVFAGSGKSTSITRCRIHSLAQAKCRRCSPVYVCRKHRRAHRWCLVCGYSSRWHTASKHMQDEESTDASTVQWVPGFASTAAM